MRKLILTVVFTAMVCAAFSQTKPKTNTPAKDTTSSPASPFRVKWDYLFVRNADNTISAIHPIQINGEIMGSGQPFTAGTIFGGIDLGAYEGHDLMIDTIKGVVLLRKIVK